MKQFWRIIERYYPWLLLLLGVDCFCSIILWISDIQAFQTLIGLVVLTSILLFSVILFVLNKRETTRRELFRDFLSDPTIKNHRGGKTLVERRWQRALQEPLLPQPQGQPPLSRTPSKISCRSAP